jgi:dienelactone hydrolase
MFDLSKVKSPIEWPGLRSQIVEAVSEAIGPLPKKRAELQVKTLDERDFPGYVRKRINYFVDEWDRISAWLFVPEGREEAPALVCCHQESVFGKDETAGMGGDSRLAYAQRFCSEFGYVTIAPDCLTAGDRVIAKQEPLKSRAFYKGAGKVSLMAKNLADHLHAVDVLTEMKRVDASRVGVIGHGWGGANAILLGAYDDRIQAAVASCGFSRFEGDKDPSRYIDPEGLCLIPKLKTAFETGNFPFDWEHILSLVAPTPLMLLTNLQDSPYSNPKSCEKAYQEAAKIYKVLGAGGALSNFSHHDGHTTLSSTLELADGWFERWL